MTNVFELKKKTTKPPSNVEHHYPSLAVAMTRSLGIALSSDDAQRLHEKLQEIATQLVLAEREACAQLCDNIHFTMESGNNFAKRIRARCQP